MKYTVGMIAKLVGLAPQTIREYENMGLLISEKGGENNYRYFDSDAVSKASAVRRLRNMGFSLNEIADIYLDVTYERYRDMVDQILQKQNEDLAYKQLVLELMQEHAEAVRTLNQQLNVCHLSTHPTFYCLDYRKNDRLVFQGEDDYKLLNSWMDKSLFTRNYSPYPEVLLHGGEADHLIGLAIKERYANALSLDTGFPVYPRESSRCVHVLIHHSHDQRIHPDGAGFIFKFMKDNGLHLSGEPFLVTEGSFHRQNEKFFFSNLFLPVAA